MNNISTRRIPELFFYALMITLWKFNCLKKPLNVGLIWLLLMGLSLLKPTVIDIVLNLKFGMYFLIGMMFYELIKDPQLKYPHFIILLSLVAIFYIRDGYESTIFTFLFVVIFYLLLNGMLLFLNNKVLVFLGKNSYPLYLLHRNIEFILIYYLIKLGFNDYFAIFISLVLIIVLSWMVYEFLEKPILKKYR